jgi:hypothetical protein
MPMSVLFRMLDPKMLSAKTASNDFFDMQFNTGKLQRIDTGFNDLGIETRINQRRHSHVTTDP